MILNILLLRINRSERVMYVCLCNGFTDRQVRGACASGSMRVAEVYPALGVRPICGKCAATVRDVLRAATETVCAVGLTESRTPA